MSATSGNGNTAVESERQGTMLAEAQDKAARLKAVFSRLSDEIHKVLVGQGELVDVVLSTFIAGGHVLIEGVPGVGKTLLVRTLANAVSLPFSRIQFTPDLMPADITGTMVLGDKVGGGHELRFEPGPILANIVLADEINRATPRTQSALLEAMQEGRVTVGGRTTELREPFIVLATQNPIEQEGTYPLPEAQLDRFMVKVVVGYPAEEDYHTILERTTTSRMPEAKPVCDGKDIMALRAIAREVPASRQVAGYAIRLVMATQPDSRYAPEDVKRCVALGASPRALQSLLLLGKVRALLAGRFAVSCNDIREVALPVLRHRQVLNFTGQAERISSDDLVKCALKSVPELSE